MNECTKKYWKQLGLFVMVIGILSLLYALIVLLTSPNEPLIGIFLFLVIVPALIPALLGYFMYKGYNWSAWIIRISIFLTLFIGFLLDFIVGLDVFSFAPFSVSFVLISIIWLILSFK